METESKILLSKPSKQEKPSQRFIWLKKELVVYPPCLVFCSWVYWFGVGDFSKEFSEKTCKEFTSFSTVALLVLRFPWNGDFEKRWSSNDMKHTQKMLFCLQVCELAFRDVLSIDLSTALVSVARGFLNWCAMASQIYVVPDRSVLLLLCAHFKFSCCISLCHFYSNYLFSFFSSSKKLSSLTLRELENGRRGGNLSSPLSWLQCSTLQVLSIIS